MKLILAVLLVLASTVVPLKAQVRQSYQMDDQSRIRAFLKRSGHALPFREARELRREKRAVSILLQILRSKQETDSELRAGAVALLGILGDPTAITPLMTFMTGVGLRSPVDQRDYEALTDIPMSLGYILAEINRHRKQPLEKARAYVLGYLLDGLQPAFWQEQAQWTSPVHAEGQRNIALTKMAILGLGISGDREAVMGRPGKPKEGLEWFAELLNRPDDALRHQRPQDAARPHAWVKDLKPDTLDDLKHAVRAAIENNRFIAHYGLEKYHSREALNLPVPGPTR